MGLSPRDEWYASVDALHHAARTRRERTEERTSRPMYSGPKAVGDDALVLYETSGQTAALTHWSFEQRASIRRAVEVPPMAARDDRVG